VVWLQDSGGYPVIYLKINVYEASASLQITHLPAPTYPPAPTPHPSLSSSTIPPNAPSNPLSPLSPTCKVRKYATAIVTAAPYCTLASPQTLRALRTLVRICKCGCRYEIYEREREGGGGIGWSGFDVGLTVSNWA